MSTERLSRSESEYLGKRVVHYYNDIVNGNRSATIDHFRKEGYKLRTLYNIFDRYVERGSTDYLTNHGRPKS